MPRSFEHVFGTSGPFTIGAEEELLLVECDTHQLAHHSTSVVEAMALHSDIVHPELYAACLELASPVCLNAGEAVATLGRLRNTARSAGATLIGSGVHPSAEPGDAEMLADERYRYIANLLGSPALRTPECALHVHVGMPEAETAVRVLNGLRPYMPLLVALAANSPFVHGFDSGYASARGIQMQRYPRFEVPRAFSGFDDYFGTLEAVMAAAEVDDPTLVWWQLRLHSRHGTVEARVMDSQSSLASVAGLTALTHGLAARAAEETPVSDAGREAVTESSYQAMRFGLDARLWAGGRMWPARELAGEALSHARPYCVELGSDAPLEQVERILREGNGADRQRAAFKEAGMPGVLRLLVADTARG